MSTRPIVLYLRQVAGFSDKSELNIDAQRVAVSAFLPDFELRVVAEFIERENGKRTEREELEKAIKSCRLYGAWLLIAKLDRLSRDAPFLMTLKRAGIDFVAADMPKVNQLTVGILAVAAEEEHKLICANIRAATQVVEARSKVRGERQSMKSYGKFSVRSTELEKAKTWLLGTS